MHEALIQVGSLLAEYRVLLLTAAIALGYAWALHLVVRGERYLVRTALFLLFVSALVLRFAAGRDYPPGMNEDEPKVLACALDALKDKRLHREGCSGIPILLNVLFQAQLVPILGPNRESMRFYPAVSGALSVIAVYGLARALRFTVSSALVSAALVTFLPWSLYYGRISFGAELTFHQLLLLWALARIVFANGGGREVIVAAFGQTLLFYDYFAGRLFFPFCVVALLLARGWRRLLVCVAAFLAVAAWLPYLLSEPQHLWAPRGQRPNLEIALVWEGVRAVFRSLVWPMAADGWITVRAAAVPPVVVLAAAAVGAVAVLRQPRIAAFLLGGFLLGIGPAVGTFPSAHRMIMAFPFVSLLAAYGLSQLPLSRWRAPLYALFLSIGGFASTCFFFSEEFWPANSRAASGAGITQLVESVPYPARRKVVVSPGLGYFAAVRTRTDPSDVVPLDTDNWWPPNAAEAIYLFSGHWEALEPVYKDMLGFKRVRSFGGPFSVTVERANWSWLQQYGWQYEVECASPKWRKSGQVPALFHINQTVPNFHCDSFSTHRWVGRWLAAEANLMLRSESGPVTVSLERGGVIRRDVGPIGFAVVPGELVSISLVVPQGKGVVAFLFRTFPGGESVPPWNSVRPEPRASLEAVESQNAGE